METEKKIKLLQLFYSGALADSVNNFERFGILEEVTFKKAAEQEIMSRGQLAQLGYKTPKELFRGFSELFGCIDWNISSSGGEYIAEGKACLLCAISKKTGSVKPCDVYCINPMRSLSRNLEPGYRLMVDKTLWDSDHCRFVLTVANSQ